MPRIHARHAAPLIAMLAVLSCGTASLKYHGTIVNTKLGYALSTSEGLFYLEGIEHITQYADKTVTITGTLSQRDDLPAFVMTKGMKEGKEPIPQGIPVEDEQQLAAQRKRRVITVQSIHFEE